MTSKNEVISGLIIIVAVPVIVLVLYATGWNLMSVIEQIVTGLLVGLLTVGGGLLYHGLRKKSEKIPAMPSTKKKGWRSRLRLSIRKERRGEIWQVAFTIVICGPILIIAMLTIAPTESLEPQASLMYNFMKIFGACVGIGLTTWGVLLISNLIYDWWEPRQQIIRSNRTAYLKVTKDFDNAFDAVQQVSDKTTKSIMLSDFQSQLVKLSKYEWDKVKNRIENKVLDCLIPEKFFDDPHVKLHIQFLDIIIDRYCQNVVEKVRKKWLKEFERMYNDPNYSTDNISRIFWILQELHGYNENLLKRFIDDATRWTKMKFTLLSNNIGFSELKKRDEMAYNRVLQYLIRRMDDAGQNENDETFKRLEILYRIAREEKS